MKQSVIHSYESYVVRYPKQLFEKYRTDGGVVVTEDVCLEIVSKRINESKKTLVTELFLYHVDARGIVDYFKHKLADMEIEFEDLEDLTEANVTCQVIDEYKDKIIRLSLQMFYEEALMLSFMEQIEKEDLAIEKANETEEAVNADVKESTDETD